MTPTITTGITVDGPNQHSYVGIMSGKVEYRIYEDREGWFLEGQYTAIPPKGKSASQIRNALDQAGGALLEFLDGKLEKWELKEKAGI